MKSWDFWVVRALEGMRLLPITEVCRALPPPKNFWEVGVVGKLVGVKDRRWGGSILSRGLSARTNLFIVMGRFLGMQVRLSRGCWSTTFCG